MKDYSISSETTNHTIDYSENLSLYEQNLMEENVYEY